MFVIPTLKELVERTRQAFRVNLPGSDAWLWPNNINPTAKVFAGLAHGVMGFADYIFRQRFALTADSENLDLHGEELGLARRPAAPAQGFVDIVASGAIVCDAGAILRRADGVEFRAIAGGSLTGAGTLSVEVIATIDGKQTVTPAGAPLEIVSGISDPDAAASVADGGIVNGLDVEDDETFRARILFRKRNPPMGGAAADYVQWAGEVSGVSFDGDRSTVFVERLWAGPGTVRVFPLMFDLYADGIPSAADVGRVADYLDAVQPAGATVTVAVPLARQIDITISGLTPDRSDVREAVVVALRAAFRRLSRVAGNDRKIAGMPYLAYPTTFSRSWLWQAVANASGEQRHVITVPADDVALAAGEFATLGSVTFI
ncbi:MAG: baseplate J/gp47 family protein [Rhodobacteraceae bacterium]|nr:baseplate J/gp47 family protein [Paracoccaceae bacterium]